MTSFYNGLVLLNKKKGLTSFDSLREIKSAFGTGKAGHCGTLDKFAEGLLLVLVGKGVKLIPLFENLDKEYYGTIMFGEETDTLDPEGEVIAEGPLPSREAIEAALVSFRGNIMQAPPAYSAMHINGKRAYKLAREGAMPEMKKRPVTIFELELLSFKPPFAEIKTRVSSGTYIRSLARDIALACNSRAHLSSLTRTKIGSFALEDAISLPYSKINENETEEKENKMIINSLRPLNRDLFNKLSLPHFLIDDKAFKDFSFGKPLSGIIAGEEMIIPQNCKNNRAAVFGKNAPDELLGIIKEFNGRWSYSNVFKGI